MRAKLFTTIPVLIFLSTSVCTAQTIIIPEGTTPVIDGTVSSGEWSDADSVIINISASSECKVLFKHDCTNLYLAYLDNLESMAVLFPEILFDINHSQSAAWEADDWWFHVSATDCYYQGGYGVYTNCVMSHPNWSGVPNFVSGPPNTDTVEIRIPFTTINMSMPDTIGIAFVLTNTATVWHQWPSTATTSSPATWATAVLSCIGIGINEKETDESFSVYLSPSGNEIIIEPKNENDIQALDIFDVTGKKVGSVTDIVHKKLNIDVSDLLSGMLLVKITARNGRETVKKLQVIR